MAANYVSNLPLAVVPFPKGVNLVSLLLGKLRVTHPCSSYFGRYEKVTMLLRLASLPTL